MAQKLAEIIAKIEGNGKEYDRDLISKAYGDLSHNFKRIYLEDKNLSDLSLQVEVAYHLGYHPIGDIKIQTTREPNKDGVLEDKTLYVQALEKIG
ncbi:hypothetical protein FAI40_03550 [Acetobacteraceae bacterium]|nr:hypothetical protein FAI40_03550 [Acetobacteraceae bacterium]